MQSHKTVVYAPKGKTKTDGGPRVLLVKGLDPLLKENGYRHRTKDFDEMQREDNPQLVVRRGQHFKIKLALSRPYSEEIDAMSFIFYVEGDKSPKHGHGTFVAVPLVTTPPEDDPSAWTAEFDELDDNRLTVKVTPPADCIVGKWKLEIDTKLNDKAVRYTYKDNIYILFNPWCEDDVVYLSDESERKEYVLNDTGLIWRGSYNRMRPAVWKYAQFEKNILDCSLYLITTIGKISHSSCRDPVKITRAVSAAVNSPDDNGCLVGNWSGEFDGGTPPTKWVGSMKILQKFYQNKKPVKYGQCWVFSGVVTTTIGIPSRTVTTYASAHDTQSSLTVDYFVDDSGSMMEEMIQDSIWNYHVWNEVWMKRPDIGSEYDGWQVIDATPQEISDDMFRCGPCPVTAVKNAEVLKPYDVAFVYAEVNADKVFWKYFGPTQPLKLLNKDPHGIGLDISTKAVGKWSREDITHNYKYPEKSEEERTSMLKALRQSASLFSRYYLNEEFNDIKFDFKLRDDIVIGSPFSVVLEITNVSEVRDYKIRVVMRVDSVLYTGKVQDSVKRNNYDLEIEKDKTVEVAMELAYDDYAHAIVDQCAFNIACLATVHETNYEYFAQDDFRVRKPDIKIKLDGEAVAGEELKAIASLTNPLPVPLQKGQFIFEGPGLTSQMKIKLSGNVEPNSDVTVNISMTPLHPGKGTIVAKFISKELDDVDGFLDFTIVDPKENNIHVNNDDE